MRRSDLAAGLAAALATACGGVAAQPETVHGDDTLCEPHGPALVGGLGAPRRRGEGVRRALHAVSRRRGYGDGVLAELLPVRPRNYHNDRFEWGTSWQDIERTVRIGRSDVMPSFEGALTDSEIRSVALLVTCGVAQREEGN